MLSGRLDYTGERPSLLPTRWTKPMPERSPPGGARPDPGAHRARRRPGLPDPAARALPACACAGRGRPLPRDRGGRRARPSWPRRRSSPGRSTPCSALLGRQGPWSDLPLIVFTRGERQPSEDVLEALGPLGNITILERPVRIEHAGQRRQGGPARPAAAVRGARPAAAARPRPTAARTSSWPCSATSCATRWPPSATPSGCSTRSARRTSRAVRQREVIERQTRHLVRMVDDLLDVSRVTLRQDHPEAPAGRPRGRRRALPARARAAPPRREPRARRITVRDRAGLRRGRPGAARAGGLQPAPERHQVHAARRDDLGLGRAARGTARR